MSKPYDSNLAIIRSCASDSYALDKSINIVPTNSHYSIRNPQSKLFINLFR